MAEEDIIFGKKQNLFGGIEPSNMYRFQLTGTAVNGVGNVKIHATLPTDTKSLYNGTTYTLCNVAGAVIRRKTTDYPKDENDGDLVADLKQSTTFLDLDTEYNGTYYYAAFPYSTHGVYNRSCNTINKAVWNQPVFMYNFKADNEYDVNTDTCKIKLSGTCKKSLSGFTIRRSTVQFPTNETEGEEVYTCNLGNNVLENDLDWYYYDKNVTQGIIYYYTVFTFTSTGAYNRTDERNRISITPGKYNWLYGYDLDTTNSDPATRVSYPSDVDNAKFTPAGMNYVDVSSFVYGDWSSTPGEGFMPRPCMVKYDGTVDYYLNPNDYTKKEDGTTSDITNYSYEGNAMVEWPKIYTKRWEENGIYHFRCCDMKIDDNYECWCNYDINNNEIDHFYTSIYTAVLQSNRLRSLSGYTCYSNKNMTDEIAYATANGAGWHTEVISDRLLIQDLLVLMARTTDCQTAYGNGNVNNSSGTPNLPGSLNTKGMFYGSNNYDTGVKVFGMENYWGNLFRRVSGLTYLNGKYSIKLTRGTYDGSTATDYNITGNGYIECADITISSNGYIDTMKVESYGRLPLTGKGTSSTYEADGVEAGTSSNWIYTPVFGGVISSGSTYATLSGPFYLRFSYVGSEKAASITTALSLKPIAK